VSRFIARYRGGADVPVAQQSRLRSWPGVHVVDAIGARTLLIDADIAVVETLRAEFPDWVVVPESTGAPPPDPVTRVPHPKRPPR
jgi:hypothetical protein